MARRNAAGSAWRLAGGAAKSMLGENQASGWPARKLAVSGWRLSGAARSWRLYERRIMQIFSQLLRNTKMALSGGVAGGCSAG